MGREAPWSFRQNCWTVKLLSCAVFSSETALGIFVAHRIQGRNPGRVASRGMTSFKHPEQGTRLEEAAESARTPASPHRPHNDGIVWETSPPHSISLSANPTTMRRKARPKELSFQWQPYNHLSQLDKSKRLISYGICLRAISQHPETGKEIKKKKKRQRKILEVFNWGHETHNSQTRLWNATQFTKWKSCK